MRYLNTLNTAKIFDLVVFFLISLFSIWLMWSTFHLEAGKIFLSSKLYSDFGAHLPLIRSFSFGENIPPEYPFFAGQPIRYHYLFYLVVGYIEKTGVPLDWALNSLSSVGLILLLEMVYLTTLLFFRNRGAAILAVLLVLFNGSLSFLEVLPETWNVVSIKQAFTNTITSQDFASFGPWDGKQVSAFWTWNIYTNQRHLAFSYGLVLAVLYPLFRHTITKKNALAWYQIFAIGIASLILPLLHQAGSVILLILTTGWVIWYWRRLALIYRVTYCLTLIFLLISTVFFASQGGSQHLEFQLGFLAPFPTLASLFTYWWFNLGLYFILLPVLLIRSRKHMGILVALSFSFFAAANVFLLSTDMINNHKFIHFFWLILQIAAAGWIATVWQDKKWFRPLLVVIVFFLTFSGIVDAFPVINDRPAHVENYTSSDAQKWIIDNTPPKSQFLSTTYLYNPASLAGRQLYLDYGYHAWSMGYNDRGKRELLLQFFSKDITNSEWCSLAMQEHIDYVIISPGSDDFQGSAELDGSYVQSIEPTYTSLDEYKIIIVTSICN